MAHVFLKIYNFALSKIKGSECQAWFMFIWVLSPSEISLLFHRVKNIEQQFMQVSVCRELLLIHFDGMGLQAGKRKFNKSIALYVRKMPLIQPHNNSRWKIPLVSNNLCISIKDGIKIPQRNRWQQERIMQVVNWWLM